MSAKTLAADMRRKFLHVLSGGKSHVEISAGILERWIPQVEALDAEIDRLRAELEEAQDGEAAALRALAESQGIEL